PRRPDGRAGRRSGHGWIRRRPRLFTGQRPLRLLTAKGAGGRRSPRSFGLLGASWAAVVLYRFVSRFDRIGLGVFKMTHRQLKVGFFVLEGLNAFATTFYFYYLFFYMERQFGFGSLGNLSLAALNGFIYMFMAWFGGRFGQRVGYFRALRLGFTTMT